MWFHKNAKNVEMLRLLQKMNKVGRVEITDVYFCYYNAIKIVLHCHKNNKWIDIIIQN